jgi:hypothetical protein
MQASPQRPPRVGIRGTAGRTGEVKTSVPVFTDYPVFHMHVAKIGIILKRIHFGEENALPSE